jgi:hypothetical protein
MLCLQYELLNVSANEMNGKTTLDTDGRNRVSHQCELSYEFSDWQMILCICYNGSICWFSLLSYFVGRCWNLLQALRLVGHQLRLLVCLEFERFPSAHHAFLHYQSQVHLEHLHLAQKAEAVSLLLPSFQSLHHI